MAAETAAVTQPGPESIAAATSNSEVNEGDVRAAWKAYVNLLRQRGEMPKVAVLDKEPGFTAPTSITFVVPTQLEEASLTAWKDDLMAFMRNELGNSQLTLGITVNIEERAVDIYSPSARMEALFTKYPLAKELAKALNLQPE